jgi:hypothetical protein
VDDPLIFVRAVHFATTLTVAGVAFFHIFIARPVLRRAASAEILPLPFNSDDLSNCAGELWKPEAALATKSERSPPIENLV